MYTFRERCDQDISLALNDGTTKIFLSTKGTLSDVSPDVKAFLDYVDTGFISGDFVKELDNAVQLVKSNRRAMKEFMTYEMALLEERLQGEQRGIQIGRTEGTEAVAIKLIRRGRPLQEIHEDTDLSLERINELAQVASQENDHVK